MFQKKRSIDTEHLENAINNGKSDKILISDVIKAMETGGFGLVLMFFSLPIIVPLPPPLPSFIAIPLIVFAAQMMFGLSSPKLPKIIANKAISRSILANIIEKSTIYFRRAEKILKPRLLFLSTAIFERIVGFFIMIFAMSVLIPLPLTNFLPGIAILIMSFGLIGRDGLFIIIGIIVGLIGILITFAIIFFGVEFLIKIKEMIF